ncbi:MAG: prepilin peptidase [Candidatus Wolfebacteria bacterium]|nr:prepilin peptidase [Candidatus Wolfebacteria bacterium]
MIYLILFILGLSAGSFINVVSLRYRPGEKVLSQRTIGGRSRCSHCGKTLSWYELVPLLSFIVQRGRCRSCGKQLSFQYPVVEMLAGLIFVFVPWRLLNFQFSILNFQLINQLSDYQLLTAVIWIIVFLLFLLLSVVDLRKFVIPDSVNFLLGFLGLVLFGLTYFFNEFDFYSSQFFGHYAFLLGFRENIFVNYFAGFLFGLLFFGAIIFLSRGKAMGLGDLKLAAALGILFGWPEALIIIALSFVLGAIISLSLMAIGRKTMKDMVPFGPFLVLGSSLVFFFGFPLFDAYFNFLNKII